MIPRVLAVIITLVFFPSLAFGQEGFLRGPTPPLGINPAPPKAPTLPASPPPPAVKPPAGVMPEKGTINPRTGDFYPGTIGGVVNPKSGEVLPKVEGGYINPKTGDVLPEQK
jgi:hypothetical protein